eukprot:scaffold30973_cov69-Phaeocystis_antarctica.AAC.8
MAACAASSLSSVEVSAANRTSVMTWRAELLASGDDFFGAAGDGGFCTDSPKSSSLTGANSTGRRVSAASIVGRAASLAASNPSNLRRQAFIRALSAIYPPLDSRQFSSF